MPTTTDDRVRVLWVIKGLGAGGAERLLCSVARRRHPDRCDYRAAYLVPWKDAVVAELEQEGVSTTCLHAPREVDLRWWARLRRLIVEERIDVVHAHSPYVAAFSRLACRTLGRGRPAMVTTEHNVWESFVGPTRWANAVSSPLDDHRFAVSNKVRGSMWPRVARATETLVHGVLLDEIRADADRAAARLELGAADGELLLMTVANFRTEKGHRDLLHAARAVCDRTDAVRFLAVGQGPTEAEVRALHAELGLGARFRFLGYRPDAVRLLAGCDLFVLPSLHEGFPIAVMEALALGVPVVSTDVGGVHDVVEHGHEGLLVRPSHPEELAEAIVSLAEAPDRLRGMAAAAASRGDQLDIEAAVVRMEEVYERLGRDRRR